MKADVDVAAAAAMIADPTRATVLMALSAERALPPSELAQMAGVSRATVSGHLSKLLDAGLVAVETGGRNRYYRLARPEVGEAIEALALISKPKPVRSLRQAAAGEALRAARTCYGHLAGQLGVALREALERDGLVERRDGSYELTERGRERLARLGVQPRAGKPCNDWSERRPHLAGPLGVTLTRRLFELGWIERTGSGRAVRATAEGRRALERELGLSLPAGGASRAR